MKKLSFIIACILFIVTANTIFAQPGQDGGVPGHGGNDNPGHGGTPPGQNNVGGSSTGNNSNETSHGVEINIPSLALVDIEGSDGEAATINLTPDVSVLEAGETVDFTSAANSDLWLNYTSVVGSGQSRDISASISGDLPSGVSLKLQASSESTGNGILGSAEGQISLEENGHNLVTGIGSAYTESGYQKGRQLTYSLEMDNDSYADLTANDYSVTITYTITVD